MRSATERDLPRLAALDCAAYGAEAYGYPVLRQLLDVHGGGLLVLDGGTESNGLAGYVLIANAARSWESWLLSLVVDKRYQGCGHGRRLLSEAVRLAERSGVSEIRGSVEPGNRAAVGLLRSLDFVVEADVADYSGPGEHRLVMCRSISRYPMR
ncbi:GNAT family N-acetyltransferase [Streptomyces sp. NPDC021093]|uniref:GNAT family N-acetyltransferase n=1 Tax=Streptomyces sp. NPDC021093 TaxID=3365112 RepID=UPI0037B87E9B